MAEIRVQEKRRSLAWLWILLIALLIAAGVWWWMTTQNQDTSVESPPDTIQSPAGATSPPTFDPAGAGTGPTVTPGPGGTPPVMDDTVGFDTQPVAGPLASYG